MADKIRDKLANRILDLERNIENANDMTYDSRFADAFWNSSKQSLLRHLMNIMTSWALVVDVWYLPPQQRHSDESVLEFTNRVKSDIATQGGLVDLDWDGQLKRQKLKPSFLREQQAKYSRRIGGFVDDATHTDDIDDDAFHN